MKHAPLIAIIALACGLAGYTIGRQTAPMPFLKARKNMYDMRLNLAKKIRGKREVVDQTVKRSPKWKPPTRRPPRPRPSRRPTAKPAKKATSPTTKPAKKVTSPTTKPGRAR